MYGKKIITILCSVGLLTGSVMGNRSIPYCVDNTPKKGFPITSNKVILGSLAAATTCFLMKTYFDDKNMSGSYENRNDKNNNNNNKMSRKKWDDASKFMDVPFVLCIATFILASRYKWKLNKYCDKKIIIGYCKNN